MSKERSVFLQKRKKEREALSTEDLQQGFQEEMRERREKVSAIAASLSMKKCKTKQLAEV